jgi:hypothetical protein
VSKKGRKVQYHNPVTVKDYWLEEDELIGLNDHSLKGVPKGEMADETKDKISEGLKKRHAKIPAPSQQTPRSRLVRRLRVGL